MSDTKPQKHATISFEEAEEATRKMIKHHLRQITFIQTKKDGVPGVDVKMEKAISGLCLQFAYLANISTGVAYSQIASFLNQINDMLNDKEMNAENFFIWMKEHYDQQLMGFIFQQQEVVISNCKVLEKELLEFEWDFTKM